MRVIIFLLCASVLYVQCKNNTRQQNYSDDLDVDSILNKNFIELCYGINSKVDTSNVLEFAMYNLNNSNYTAAIDAVKNRHAIDTVWYSGFYGYEVSNSGNLALKYLLFRYENFLDNLPAEEQRAEYGNSYETTMPGNASENMMRERVRKNI